jgi:hypothetical protein
MGDCYNTGKRLPGITTLLAIWKERKTVAKELKSIFRRDYNHEKKKYLPC